MLTTSSFSLNRTIALAGTFTLGGNEREWCERRLLARIHRYTVKRLRAEIEPVAARDYLRFLFDWQVVSPDAQRERSQAVALPGRDLRHRRNRQPKAGERHPLKSTPITFYPRKMVSVWRRRRLDPRRGCNP